MTISGMLVVNQEGTREGERKLAPIRIRPFDNSALLKKFDRSLVGRVLNVAAQGHRVKSFVSLLPTIWNCEGRIQGQDLGHGRFMFRFDEEADLKMVLDKRPFHFDQWMTTLERWVPTVRPDFPSTIVFWIKIIGIPTHYWVEETVVDIGRGLGDLLDWDVFEGRVRVSLEAEVPLTFQRDLEFANGDMATVTFDYDRLYKFCGRCKRLTHDERFCPSSRRGCGENAKAEAHAKGAGKAEKDSEGSVAPVNRARGSMEDRSNRRKDNGGLPRQGMVKLPVRRELDFAGSSGLDAMEMGIRSDCKEVGLNIGKEVTGMNRPRAPWFKDSVEEARVANGIEGSRSRSSSSRKLPNPDSSVPHLGLEVGEIISPLKEILSGGHKQKVWREEHSGRNGEKAKPRKSDKPVSVALQVRKKIKRSPFRPSKMLRQSSLSVGVWKNDGNSRFKSVTDSFPSSSATVPGKGKNVKENARSAVQEKPLAST